jgi:hypothetical protein
MQELRTSKIPIRGIIPREETEEQHNPKIPESKEEIKEQHSSSIPEEARIKLNMEQAGELQVEHSSIASKGGQISKSANPESIFHLTKIL